MKHLSSQRRRSQQAFVFSPVNAASAVVVRGLDAVIQALARVTKEPSEDSPYLKDHLKPQTAEIRLCNAPVSGRVPSALAGMFVSVIPSGHNRLPIGGYHVFEGDGSVASVRIRRNGTASFTFHHLETEKLIAERALGHSPVLSIMAMKGVSGLTLTLLSQVRNAIGRNYAASTANTNVVALGRRIFALMEQEMPYELAITPDGNSLQAVAPLTFDSYQGPFTAHPKHHPSNGLTYALNYTPMSTESDANIVILNGNTELVRTIPLRLGRKPMIHDAAITENYFIILDLPLLISPKEMLNKNSSLVRVHHDKHARIGLFPVDALDESEIVWFDVPPCSVFHTLNAYETDKGNVVLHLCQMSDFELCNEFSCSDQHLVRYDLNIQTGKATSKVEPLDLSAYFKGDTRADMPRVHPSKIGKKAKYGFGLVLEQNKEDHFEKLAGLWKYNMDNGQLDVVKFDEGFNGVAEPAFIPKGSDREDECYVTIFVRDPNDNVCLHIYDAATMDDKPLARVHAPPGFHVPTGFHSTFFTEKELARLSDSNVSRQLVVTGKGGL